MSSFQCLDPAKESVEVRDNRTFHINFFLLRWTVVSFRPTTRLEVYPCRLSMTAYSVHSQVHFESGGLLRTKPEDAPCQVTRNAFEMDSLFVVIFKITLSNIICTCVTLQYVECGNIHIPFLSMFAISLNQSR